MIQICIVLTYNIVMKCRSLDIAMKYINVHLSARFQLRIKCPILTESDFARIKNLLFFGNVDRWQVWSSTIWRGSLYTCECHGWMLFGSIEFSAKFRKSRRRAFVKWYFVLSGHTIVNSRPFLICLLQNEMATFWMYLLSGVTNTHQKLGLISTP